MTYMFTLKQQYAIYNYNYLCFFLKVIEYI